MNRTVQAVVQAIAAAVQVLNASQDALPPRARLWVAIAMTALQTILGILGQGFNPDGTSAKVAYEPKK